MSPELVPPVPLLPRHRSVDRAFPPPLTLFGGAHEGGSWDMGALELGPGEFYFALAPSGALVLVRAFFLGHVPVVGFGE